MMMLATRRGAGLVLAALLLIGLIGAGVLARPGRLVPAVAAAPLAQGGTPTAGDPCAAVTPATGMDGATAMAAGAAMAGTTPAFDQAYIDMMIPHHASIIAMAEAALPRLTDERLREIAQAVVATQRPEIEELRGLRERFYGSAEPLPMAEMDERTMGAMHEMMPGMGTMDEMLFQMDPAAQVAAVCAAADPDLAFIDLTIPHHEMAIVASEVALDRATQPEIQDFARRVIAAQQREIETLTEIRQELFGAATPAASPDAGDHEGSH
jgi:uncharacterized protein (DUF305 family)